MKDRLTSSRELADLIGEDAFANLAENFGGTRLYVPERVSAEHEIARAIGLEAARRLSERYSPDYIKVPLARELRALRYRGAGLSNARIARKLGITECAVEKLFRRIAV